MSSLVAATLALISTWAALPSENEIVNSLGMKLVRIEPGSFRMGQDAPAADYRMNKHPARFDDCDPDERPAHRVTIGKPFHTDYQQEPLHVQPGLDPPAASVRRSGEEMRRKSPASPRQAQCRADEFEKFDKKTRYVLQGGCNDCKGQ